MKKKLLSILAVTALFVSSAIAQFEGKIVYGLDYELPPAMESRKSMLPSEMIMLVSKEKTKFIQKTMMGEQIVITNIKSNETTLLMDMMGKKMAISVPAPTEEELQKEKLPVFKYDDKTKKIAGYKCKHAIMIVEDENGDENEYDVYYTEEIPASANTKLKGLKGFPLEYTVVSNGMVIIATAKEVKKEKFPKSEFVIPEGFEKMTLEEFQKSMGM